MKKFLFIVTASVLCVTTLFGQERPIYKLMLSPIRSEELKFEDDSCKINFDYRESNGLIYVQVFNKTSKRAYIEWENARLDGARVVFGDDRRINMGNAKADEAIPANSASINRDILSEGWVGTETISNPVSPSVVRGRGGNELTAVIPVRFGEGETIDYQFRFAIFSYNPVDVGQIAEGMKAKDVKKILGKPDDMWVDPWGTANTKADWYYAGNAVIRIRKGVVDSIDSLKRSYMDGNNTESILIEE